MSYLDLLTSRRELSMQCDECGRVPTDGMGLMTDFRGHSFALVCHSCAPTIRRLLNVLFCKYGGVPDKCACWHSPTIQSIQHLRTEVEGVTA